MSDAPAPIAQQPTTIPPPVPQENGAGALMDMPQPKEKVEPIGGAPAPEPVDDSQEFELDIKGQKQKVKANKAQLTQLLQKSLYADQMIKDATQAKRGAEAMMSKLKSGDLRQIREVFEDPAIGGDIKKIALGMVTEMMEDEKLTPEQRESREWKSKAEKYEAQEKAREEAEKQKTHEAKDEALRIKFRGEIIGAMKDYPELPQTQETMDACILNMRANYRVHGILLSAKQAMEIVSKRYWAGIQYSLGVVSPEKIYERFGQKGLDKLQSLRLKELRDKTNPANKAPEIGTDTKKKKYITEKEYDKAFAQRIAGL